MIVSPQLLHSGVLGVIAGLLWIGSHPADAQQPSPEFKLTLSMDYSAEQDALIVSGWGAAELETLLSGEGSAYPDLLQVRVALPGRDTDSLPPVVGAYRVVEGELHFRPRYGWSAGQRYKAHLDSSTLSKLINATSFDEPTLETSFTVPIRTPLGEPPTVTAVYPSADALPENLLRFYIEFSGPMQRGEVYNHVYLLDHDKQRVEAPFLRIGQEFWAPNMTRLTLLLDPGRIKRGVAPNVQAGVPLDASTSYELVIETDLEDAHGRSLAQAHRKPFTVTEADRTSPDPKAWQLSQPERGTQQPLVMMLGGAVDPIITKHFVRVEDEQGRPIQGTLAFQDDEKVLTFTPRELWSVGRYRLAVHLGLEDYAGNRVDAVFDMEPDTVSELIDGERVVYHSFSTATSK